MNIRDQLSGLFWLTISIFVCAVSLWDNVGTFSHPGPGFLPFWSGLSLGTLSIILIVASYLKEKGEGEIKNLWKGVEWGKVISVFTSLFIYVILLPQLGYLITTFGLMTFLFGVIRRPRLWIHMMSGLITVLITYIVFYVWLNVQLPKGILSF